jgi:putative FmdB family regulatory protein
MPIYDYKCQECGKVSEIFQHGLSNKVIKCPSCGSEKLERLFSASYMIRMDASTPGTTCCGRTERCDTPPCSTGGVCRRG